jgi:hypothetical protein
MTGHKGIEQKPAARYALASMRWRTQTKDDKSIGFCPIGAHVRQMMNKNLFKIIKILRLEQIADALALRMGAMAVRDNCDVHAYPYKLSKYFSASNAAIQPVPAEVTA